MTSANWEIYKMNAAGRLEMNLTNNRAMEDANDARPSSWSSDATSIVFAATGHPRFRLIRKARLAVTYPHHREIGVV